MKSIFAFPLRLLAYWLLFFAVFRIWFIGWFHAEWPAGESLSVWQALWYAWPLDLSTAAYLMALPVLLWFGGLGAGTRWQPFAGHLIAGINALFIGLLVLVFGANIFIYEEWHTLLNNRALEYLSTPRAMLDSMSLPFKILCISLYGLFVWLMWRLYRLIVGANCYEETPGRRGLLALPMHTGLLFLAIRGGLGVIPINESAVYYSPHLFNNHAATNAIWNLIHSILEVRSTTNHYRFMDDETARARTGILKGENTTLGALKRDFFTKPDSLPSLNIVFLILESHTAQVIGELGGEADVCPNLSRLIREGILFENIYGSGYRTDQGLVSVLGGYPAQPDQSIVLQTDKAAKLHSLPRILHDQGYSTAFYYGGELTFANIGVWLANQRFGRIVSEKDFDRAEKTQRWGVDDLILLQRAARDIATLKEPFFATAMTLSLHPPYDVPYQSRWNGQTEREKFLNSAAFADHAVGEFFKTAEQQTWYDRTLFVLVADHGARSPGGVGLDDPKSRHIPLIIFGKPLDAKWHNKRMAIYGNHHDIPATVLGMWDLYDSNLPWSRNLWSFDALINTLPNAAGQRLESAYYTNETGLGWANSRGKGFYSFGSGEWHIFEGQLDSTAREDAKAYLQTLYDDFLTK